MVLASSIGRSCFCISRSARYREIADVLGLSETNVGTKINRLKQMMRRDIAGDVETAHG